jgi:PE family
MSYVIVAPEMMTAAAADLATIGSTVSEAHTAAAPALAPIPAAADEVSVGIAHLFSAHAQGFQALAGKAATFHEQFVQNMKAGASSYTWIEEAIAALLRVDPADVDRPAWDLWRGAVLYVEAHTWLLYLLLPIVAPFAIAGLFLFLLIIFVAALLSASAYDSP